MLPSTASCLATAATEHCARSPTQLTPGLRHPPSQPQYCGINPLQDSPPPRHQETMQMITPRIPQCCQRCRGNTACSKHELHLNCGRPSPQDAMQWPQVQFSTSAGPVQAGRALHKPGALQDAQSVCICAFHAADKQNTCTAARSTQNHVCAKHCTSSSNYPVATVLSACMVACLSG